MTVSHFSSLFFSIWWHLPRRWNEKRNIGVERRKETTYFTWMTWKWLKVPLKTKKKTNSLLQRKRQIFGMIWKENKWFCFQNATETKTRRMETKESHKKYHTNIMWMKWKKQHKQEQWMKGWKKKRKENLKRKQKCLKTSGMNTVRMIKSSVISKLRNTFATIQMEEVWSWFVQQKEQKVSFWKWMLFKNNCNKKTLFETWKHWNESDGCPNWTSQRNHQNLDKVDKK